MSSAIFSTPSESRVGQMVIYKLSEHDAKAIVASRLSAGRGTVSGNDPREGDEYPALIVRDWAGYDAALKAKFEAGEITLADEARTPVSWRDHIRNSSVNLQVFLDGTDVFWATSRSEFDGRKHGTFAKRTDDEIADALGLPHISRVTTALRVDAIKAFQRHNDLVVDGIWGSATEGKAVRVLDIGPTAWQPSAKGHFFTV